MELATNLLLSYIVLQDLVFRSKTFYVIWFQRGRNVDQNKVFSQGEEAYPKGGKYLSESSHEGEVAKK